MRRIKVRGTHLGSEWTGKAMILALFVLSAFAAGGQFAPKANADFTNALWVSTSHELFKLSRDTGSLLLEIDLRDAETFTLDDERGIIWAFAKKNLLAYGFNGQRLLSIPVPSSQGDIFRAPGGQKQVFLALDHSGGGVWLGIGKAAGLFNLKGELVTSLSLSDNVQGLALDPASSMLWIATRTTVNSFSTAGNAIDSINLGKKIEVRDLQADPSSGNLWVVLKDASRLYDHRGNFLLEVSIPKLQFAAPDRQGNLWVATDKRLLRLDQALKTTLEMDTFSKPHDKITALAVDPQDLSAWVSTDRDIRRVYSDGRITAFSQASSASLASGSSSIPKGNIHDLAVYVDTIPPVLRFITPEEGAVPNSRTPSITLGYGDAGSGVDSTTLKFKVDSATADLACSFGDDEAVCTPMGPLPEGPVHLSATIEDFAGNMSVEAGLAVRINRPPVARDDTATANQGTAVSITVLGNDFDPDGDRISVASFTQPAHGTVAFLSNVASYTPSSGFSGQGLFTYTISDGNGGSATATVRVTVNQGPVANAGSSQTITLPASASLAGTASDDGLPNPPATLTIQWSKFSGPGNVTFGNAASLSTTASFSESGAYVLRLTASDGALSSTSDVTITVNPQISQLPPDPATVAPKLDTSVATTVADSTAFLYTGSNPIQTGVAPGTITPVRAAVVRGKVLDGRGAALSGVKISILGHPEVGQTLSRTDGLFDMAVNGGGPLTLRYQKANFPSAQRQVNVPWQDFTIVSDVILVPYDPNANLVSLCAANAECAPRPMQVVRGSTITDSDGTRKATLLVPTGTTATLTLPDGSNTPITQMTVRATEYTVGPNGPQAMPAPLPPTSGYTYEVEFSVDEAEAAAATRVNFSQPLISYTENFLGFPVGSIVPSGDYDRQNGVWIPASNGRVIKITGVSAGLAVVDTGGTGGLTPITLSSEERQQLALLYPVGQQLWRVPINYFLGIK